MKPHINNQRVSTVQCCFTSTETVRLVRADSPGRPPGLFTQLLNSERKGDDGVGLHVLGCRVDILGTNCRKKSCYSTIKYTADVYVCTFRPGNFTGWGSEGVNFVERFSVWSPDTPSIAFRHLPPNSACFSYATDGALFISAQLSSDAVSALRKVRVLIRL